MGMGTSRIIIAHALLIPCTKIFSIRHSDLIEESRYMLILFQIVLEIRITYLMYITMQL